MDTTPVRNDVIFQHNNLIRTNLHMGELEARIMVMALQGIHQNDEGPLPPIRLKITDIYPDAGGKAYRLVGAACKALYDHDLRLVPVGSNPQNSEYRTRIVSDIGIDAGTGLVTGNFAPKIRPYLMEITKVVEGSKPGFTSADVKKLLVIKNANSQRLYWILKSYQSLGSKEIALDKLQDYLFEGNSPYGKWGDFNRYVLEVAVKQLGAEDVGFPFSYEAVKTGKKVTAIKFALPPQERPEKSERTKNRLGQGLPVQDDAGFEAFLAQFDDRRKLTYGLLLEDGIDKPMAQRILQLVGPNDDALKKVVAARKAGNLAKQAGKLMCPLPAFIITELQGSFPGLKSKK